MLRQLFRTKSLDAIMHEAENPEHQLKRALGSFDIVMLGIGAIIGSGIFATIGTAVAGDALRPGAGPAIVLSFGLTAVACAFCGLCYAEFASLVPIAGSAYTYSYATLGRTRGVDHRMGPDHRVCGGECCGGHRLGGVFPSALRRDRMAHTGLAGGRLPVRCPGRGSGAANRWAGGRIACCSRSKPGARIRTFLGIPLIFNALAVGIVAVITWLLIIGVKESVRVNNVMVVVKLVILMFFIYAGSHSSCKPENWTPFMPNGFSGVWVGASLIFFAYIGFDAISTAAEECRRPGARPADRHHRITGDLYGHLYRGGAGAHGHGAVAASGRGGPAGGGIRVRPLRRLRGDRGGRRGGVDDGGSAGLPVRPAAHLLLDVARRPVAGVLLPRAPEVQDAAHHDVLDRRGGRRGLGGGEYQ